MYLKIRLHSAAAEEIIRNYITFLDPGGINYVIIVGPTVHKLFSGASMHLALLLSVNKLKTTPTPNKNGSHGIKGGVLCMPCFWVPYAIFSVEIPCI